MAELDGSRVAAGYDAACLSGAYCSASTLIAPVADYGPLLERAGFDVGLYEETERWSERLTSTYQALVDARPSLAAEMGEAACGAAGRGP